MQIISRYSSLKNNFHESVDCGCSRNYGKFEAAEVLQFFINKRIYFYFHYLRFQNTKFAIHTCVVTKIQSKYAQERLDFPSRRISPTLFSNLLPNIFIRQGGIKFRRGLGRFLREVPRQAEKVRLCSSFERGFTNTPRRT